jgi:hypothetical protein
MFRLTSLPMAALSGTGPVGRSQRSQRAELRRLIWPRWRQHPEYYIGGYNRWPRLVYVKFTPYADAAEIRRLAEFNFSCVTGHRACRTRQDIMPVAVSEVAPPWDDSESPSCDAQVVRIVSRDTDNAVLVDVLENRPAPRYDSDPNRMLRVRMVQRLKGASFWELGGQRKVESGSEVDSLPGNVIPNLHPGDRVIILFEQGLGWAAVPEVMPELCGVLAYTESNLAIVRAGVAQDERVAPFIEYNPQFRPRKFSDPPDVPGAPGPHTSFPAQP